MPRLRLIKRRFDSIGTIQRFGSLPRGPFTWSPTEYENYPYESHRCLDEVNQRESDNPLSIRHEGRLFTPMNGTWQATTTDRIEYNNHIPSSMRLELAHDVNISTLIPSIGEVATSVLARSNPSRPYVSVPNFLYELKDLPGMIQDIGKLKIQAKNIGKKGFQRVTPKNAASHYLSYAMGWSPLIGDLRKLLDFQAQVDKKMRELQNLYRNGGLQRRVRLPAWKAVKEFTIFNSIPCDSLVNSTISHRVTGTSEIERWGTVRWIPKSLPSPDFSSKDMARLARDLTFGMRGISTKQIWDAIPWTWLIGWFSNADEFLQAHSNSIPLEHSTPCIMTRTYTKTSWRRLDTIKVVTGGDGDASLLEKSRVVSSGSLSATIPFLNRRQLSIIGALAIQRKR